MPHAVVDLKGWSRGTYPFVVAVMNPNTAYLMSMTARRGLGDRWEPISRTDGSRGRRVGLLSRLVTAGFWLML